MSGFRGGISGLGFFGSSGIGCFLYEASATGELSFRHHIEALRDRREAQPGRSVNATVRVCDQHSLAKPRPATVVDVVVSYEKVQARVSYCRIDPTEDCSEPRTTLTGDQPPSCSPRTRPGGSRPTPSSCRRCVSRKRRFPAISRLSRVTAL
jgi:hypothetical protein